MDIILKKKKEYLICFDSDGCVIDGMTIKHEKCFGPALVEEWALEKQAGWVLDYWNKVNLYTETRGINRFKGLLLVLEEIKKRGIADIDTVDLRRWMDSSEELSNKSLETEIMETNSTQLKKVLAWSLRVNKKVDSLTDEQKKPFDGAREGLAAASAIADIAVISSANAKAVEDEWGKNDLLSYVDMCMTQEMGSKEECIRRLLALGYEKKCVMMVGDSPGDRYAAQACGVSYHPIEPGKERESWQQFRMDKLTQWNSREA